MAVLQDNPIKCFLGEWDDGAPICTGMTIQEVIDVPSCNCADRWQTLETAERGDNKVYWRGENVTIFTMNPGESMVSRGAAQVPNNVLKLQIFFSCQFPFKHIINRTLTKHTR